MQLGPTSAHLPQRAGGLIQSHLLHPPSIVSCRAVDMWQQSMWSRHGALESQQDLQGELGTTVRARHGLPYSVHRGCDFTRL
jgi:hypothetical protein